MSKRIMFDKSVISKCERYDFEDDGTRFYGYEYKGKLPITKAVYENEAFIAIRLDYIGFSYQQYKDDLDILNYYNKCEKDEFDAQFFNKLCEYIYQKYLENNIIERPIMR